MARSTGWLAGRYVAKIGSEPAHVVVLIEPSLDVVRDRDAHGILVGSRTVELVDGAVSVEVPATDDMTLDPSGCTHSVTARLDSYGVANLSGIVVPTGETVQAR